jgi:fumarate reductase subunit C
VHLALALPCLWLEGLRSYTFTLLKQVTIIGEAYFYSFIIALLKGVGTLKQDSRAKGKELNNTKLIIILLYSI